MITPASWVDLTKVKAHLNIKTTDSDDELGDFIGRAEAAIANRVGHVKQLTAPVVEYREGARSRVWLDNHPVIAVDEISVAGVVVDEADRDVADPTGWYLEDEWHQRAGVIKHTDRFPAGWVKVTHRPGYAVVPKDLELAALEMVRHLWESQRGGAGSSHPGLRNRTPGDNKDAEDAAGEDSLPPRVLELIRPYLTPERHW